MRTKWLEMQGKTVNGFKILEVYRENKRTMAKVVCPACGKIYITRAEQIKKGKDCGCTTKIKMNDLTGKKFGRLTAIEPTERKASNDSIIWKCICDCGKISFVNSGSLTSGRIKSCGCLRKPHEIKQGKRMAAETKKQCIDGTSIRSLTMKKPKTNTSGIKGVSWDKSRNKWVAQIQFKGKNYYLGRYANKEDAREAREKAEKEMFGKFLEEHKEYVKDKKDKKN
jgi:hypothetical protein